MFRFALCWLLIGNFLKLAEGDAFLSLKFLTFENRRGQGHNGNCCDGRFVFCVSQCDHSFTICLDRIDRPARDISRCEYGKFVSNEITDRNNIVFTNRIGSIPNPIVQRLNSWPGRIQVKVDVVDVDDHNANDHVDYLQNVITLQPGTSFPRASQFIMRSRVQLTFEARVYCGQDYYGVDCSTYCKPNDGYTGHYTCHQDGTKQCLPGWTGTNCAINENNCIGNLCLNGGTCRDLISTYECVCPSEFKGHFCEEDINECLNQNNCVHGFCVNTHGSFLCMCHKGYAGDKCSIDINDCLSSPCTHNADCTDLIGDFKCSCPAGFTGKVCDEDVDECQLDPCKNNGTCVNFNSGFRCDCLTGYHGNDCSLDLDECTSFPCRNGAVCKNFNGGYECQCAPGFEGFHCELDINECDSSNTSCYNNGICVNTQGSYTCKCQSGYSGFLCEINVNECLSHPCRQKSTCYDLPGDYICHCQEGYTGQNCEQNINECLDAVCKNGGTCTDMDGSFECICSPFWEGRTCQENINECLSNPCQHGGTCKNIDEGFLCICPAGFVGKLCEADMDECELDSSCENNATCVNWLGSFTCVCLEGWSGQRCEEDINECERGYCDNLGTCINTQGGVNCMCPINWQGKRCDEDVNECAMEESPCRNNATCHNMIGTFHCECADGWTGPLCSEDVNECLQFPEVCKTQGNSTSPENSTDSHILCLNTSPGFLCTCSEGWTGLLCDEDIDECLENQNLCSLEGNSTGVIAADLTAFNNSYRVCMNTHPGYVCTCSEGLTGQNCDMDIGEHDFVTTASLEEDTMNYESSVAYDYEAHTSDNAGHSTTVDVNETSNTVTAVDTTMTSEDISVPFYLACQITPKTEWIINTGLMKMFLDTYLFQGKKLEVTHISDKAISKNGEVITKIYPFVTVDGKSLSDHEISYVISKLSHKIKGYLHCSLFLGAVQDKFSYSASVMNSATPNWFPALITVCCVLVAVTVVVIILKCWRTIKVWFQKKIQDTTPALSITNPLYVSVGEVPELREDSDSKDFWPEEDSKPFTKTNDYECIPDIQPGGVTGSAHSTVMGNDNATEQQSSRVLDSTQALKFVTVGLDKMESLENRFPNV